jgi:hypothetical protein
MVDSSFYLALHLTRSYQFSIEVNTIISGLKGECYRKEQTGALNPKKCVFLCVVEVSLASPFDSPRFIRYLGYMQTLGGIFALIIVALIGLGLVYPEVLEVFFGMYRFPCLA